MRSIRHSFMAVAALLVSASAVAQGPATGRILVSTDTLLDSDFGQSVLLLLHHDTDGSLGVFLNRPTWIEADEVFPQVAPLQDFRGTLYLGGPITPTQFLVVFIQESPVEPESTHIIGDIYVTADLEILNEPAFARGSDSRLRMYAGHAAWAPGQLDNEIGNGSWRVLLGREELIFSPRPLELWEAVVEIEDGELSARNIANQH